MQVIYLEHRDFSPGDTYDDHLIFSGGFGAVLNEMVLNEGSNSLNGPMKFRGKFQEAETVNKNKRMYPFDILDTNVKSLQEAINAGGLIGELDHPTDSIIHFANCSHKITKLWWENKILMGEGVILNTPGGKLLKSLLNDGVRIGISSRGVGNGKVNEEGILVIGESYKLITFDAVADPSTNKAFQEKVVSSKRETVNYNQMSPEIPVKNVNSGIHINKDLVKACFGGIVHKQAKELKARLS